MTDEVRTGAKSGTADAKNRPIGTGIDASGTANGASGTANGACGPGGVGPVPQRPAVAIFPVWPTPPGASADPEPEPDANTVRAPLDDAALDDRAPDNTALDDAALARWYGRGDAPVLRVNFVSSLDGAVELDGYSAGLSGRADKRVFAILRMLCDALVVGAGTLRRERYRGLRLDPTRRAWRRAHGLSEFPTLVVVSASLDLDPTQAAFADAPVRPLVLTHHRAVAPAGLTDVAELVRHGETDLDLAAALAELRRRGHRQLLCEGGPRLFGALIRADLVDELCLTMSPLLAGAGAERISTGPGSAPRGMALRHVLAAADGTLFLRHSRAGRTDTTP